jgi:hypothetical protein
VAWLSFAGILREARQIAADEIARPPASCPNDGEPLRFGPDGILFCPFDGWRDQQ